MSRKWVTGGNRLTRSWRFPDRNAKRCRSPSAVRVLPCDPCYLGGKRIDPPPITPGLTNRPPTLGKRVRFPLFAVVRPSVRVHAPAFTRTPTAYAGNWTVGMAAASCRFLTARSRTDALSTRIGAAGGRLAPLRFSSEASAGYGRASSVAPPFTRKGKRSPPLVPFLSSGG
jgi:hypothetical protein